MPSWFRKSSARADRLVTELQAALARQEQELGQLRATERRLELAQRVLQRNNEVLEQRVAERTAALMQLNLAGARTETRWHRVVEAAPSAMLMVDPEGRIELVNAEAERMFGYSRAELLGASVDMLLPLPARASHPALRAAFFTSPALRPMAPDRPLFALRRDGSKFEIEVRLSPIDTEDGPRALAVVSDISARVQIEAQLRQSQKLEAIGQVTAGVAHDFNNLLQALSGSLELLTERIADQPDAMEWADMALRATGRGSQLTSRLLAFARRQVLSPRAVALAPLLAEVAGLIQHLFDSRPGARSTLLVDPGPAGLAVLTDAAQLEAALLNLAVNARDAMPKGGQLRIVARSPTPAEAAPEGGAFVVITVADTGTGMDAATLARACEPFFTTKGGQGTGLGLSMVQGFARQSGGEARIASVVGEGTTVALWLPAAVAGPVAPASPAQPAALRGRVLLVDDSADVRVIVASFLRHVGLEVTAVESGDAGLAGLLAGERFDLIVTDVAMPDLNGIDLVAQAREMDPALPAVIITGFYDAAMVAGLENAVVLRKPFGRTELVGHVQRLIAGRAPVRGTT